MNDLTVYNSVKDQMKTGDLLQWRSHSLIGGAIRWRTDSKWNHSSLVIRLAEYEGLERRRFTTEALEHGVVLNLLSRRLEQFNGHVWWFPLQDYWDLVRQKIGERALDYIGIPYDYGSIVAQVFGKVSADARALFCSEYCYLSWGFKGVAPDPGDITEKIPIFKEPVKLVEA